MAESGPGLGQEDAPAAAPPRRAGLLAELRRRGVVRAVVAYAVAAFAVLQVAEPVLHALHLPDGWLTGLVVLLGLGFPVTAALSWAYDLTRRGVVRTPDAEPASPGAPGPSRPGQAGAILLAAALGAALTWFALRAPALPVDADGRITVAVADFANETGEKELDSISGLLITALEQSARLRVVTRSRMFDVLRQLGKGGVERIDEPLAREVGRGTNARALLMGSIRRLGDSYVVDLRALDPLRDEYLFTVRDRATGKEAVFDLVDRIGEVTRSRLGPPGGAGATPQRKVASMTTDDVKAWELLFRARQAMDHFAFDEAQDLLGVALEVDPDFALAHYQLAALVWWVDDGSETRTELTRKHVEAAWRLRDRLPEKERLALLAFRATAEGRRDEAFRLRDQAAEAYPFDKEALFYAGDVRFHLGEPGEAIPFFERALRLDSRYGLAIDHLADAYQEAGTADQHVAWLLAEARMVLDSPAEPEATARGKRREFPRAPGLLPRSLAKALLGADREAEAVALFKRAIELDGTSWPPGEYIGYLWSKGRAEEAEAAVVANLSESQRRGEAGRRPYRRLLAMTYVVQGRYSEALALLDSIHPPNEAAISAAIYRQGLGVSGRSTDAVRAATRELERLQVFENPKWWLVAWNGVINLGEMGDPGNAARLAAVVRRSAVWEALTPGRRQVIDALAAWGSGSTDSAEKELRAAATHSDVNLRYIGLLLLGVFEQDRGRCPESVAALEQARGMRWSPALDEPIWTRSLVLHSLGACYERLGEVAKARERNEEILRQWTRADAHLPLLAEAKAACRKLGCRPAPARSPP